MRQEPTHSLATSTLTLLQKSSLRPAGFSLSKLFSLSLLSISEALQWPVMGCRVAWDSL